jgi:hypothetical protein
VGREKFIFQLHKIYWSTKAMANIPTKKKTFLVGQKNMVKYPKNQVGLPLHISKIAS